MNTHKNQVKTLIDRLPEALQKQVLEHRKSKLDNTNNCMDKLS